MSTAPDAAMPGMEIGPISVQRLRGALHLPLLLPGGDGYEEARRVWKNEGATGAN